jgi:hypothetical protein
MGALERTAESSGDEPLEAQLRQGLDEAKPGEQEE